ncbi:MAG: flagellar export chaperone FliS [Oscillospiraceae bacterium]|nr:flagellar export chaperone FliS [Oscillospiraceae bacterium]
MINAYASYKRQSVTTMTPIEIIVKLYDECDRQLNRALHFIEKKDYESTNAALMKSVDVVSALRSVLDLDIQMGVDLDKLYLYFTQELIDANIKKDAEKIRTLLPMIGDLREAFVQVSRMSVEQINLQAMQNAQGTMQAQVV